MARLMDEIRKAVETCGKTRYRIAQESGVSAGQLSRLVNGERGLRVETIERLADYLGLRIRIEPKTKTRTRKAR
jgi:transcriptional regulator with XRE-family HTH domain